MTTKSKEAIEARDELLKTIHSLKTSAKRLKKDDPLKIDLLQRATNLEKEVAPYNDIIKTERSKVKLEENDNAVMEFFNGLRSCHLYNADPDCEHVNDPWNYSGIQCKKCSGWFCL